MRSNLSKLDQEIAQLLGIQESYTNNSGIEIFAMPQVFAAVVEELLPAHLKGRVRDESLLQALWEWRYERPLRENLVVWEGKTLNIELRSLGKAWEWTKLRARLKTEEGEVFEADFEIDVASNQMQMPSPTLPDLQANTYKVHTAWRLPLGYHTLTIETALGKWESLVVCAPESLPEIKSKDWGVFAPTYALRSSDDMGAGSYTELEELCLMMAEKGATTVATLPLLPAFLEDWKCDPSPYSPASRLFWNEFYVDPRRAPEWVHTPQAQKIYEDSKHLIEGFRSQEWVPYLEIAHLKRQILMPMAEKFFSSGDQSRLHRAMMERPDIAEYARFRAFTAQRGQSWWVWEDEYKDSIAKAPIDQGLFQLYVYSQLLAVEQLHALADKSASKGMSFYLDLPVGVHSDSYDVWKHKHLYCLKLSAGAPPDPFFTKGQNWGFPPFHPQALHEDRFEHFRQIIRHHLSESSLLRLDHVMGLHRLYVVPHGAEAHEGLYIRFPHEQLYAILMLEASRANARLVGEDLGTVPEEVRLKMNQHQLNRLFVFQYEADAGKPTAVTPPDANTVASLNTHDMPMWAAYWRALDLDDRQSLGLLTPDQRAKEEKSRAQIRTAWVAALKELELLDNVFTEKDESKVLNATLNYLGESSATLVLLNLEDAFFETRPQNTPGTFRERKNWLGRMPQSLKSLELDPKFRMFIETLERSRRDARQKSC